MLMAILGMNGREIWRDAKKGSSKIICDLNELVVYGAIDIHRSCNGEHPELA